MSDYVIYIEAPGYLADWIKHTFGNPAVLLKDSPESRVLNECLVKLPTNAQPSMPGSSKIAIAVPYFKGKDPRVYNYLHKTGEIAVAESFRSLFIKNLCEEILHLDNGNIKMSTLLYMFLEKHGISEDHYYAVAQIYYRMRKKYFIEKEIKI